MTITTMTIMTTMEEAMTIATMTIMTTMEEAMTITTMTIMTTMEEAMMMEETETMMEEAEAMMMEQTENRQENQQMKNNIHKIHRPIAYLVPVMIRFLMTDVTADDNGNGRMVLDFYATGIYNLLKKKVKEEQT